MTCKDGGPAFPVKGGMMFFAPEEQSEDIKQAIQKTVERAYEGMSLRDWFAGQALVGLVADTDYVRGRLWAEVTVDCYGIADAMLKAREQSK